MIAGAVKDSRFPAYAVEFQGGTRRVCGAGPCAFSIALTGEPQFEWFIKADPYSVALAFIRGEFGVRGDLVSAIRLKQAGYRPGWKGALFAALAGFASGRLENWLQSRERAARNIRFHYDRSNDFYRQFLDSRLQYSEGYYQDISWSLEQEIGRAHV